MMVDPRRGIEVSRGSEEMCITQVQGEEVDLSGIERKRVRGSRTKGYRAAASRTSQANARLRASTRMNSALFSLRDVPLDRGCGEKCWRAGVEKPKHLKAQVSRVYRGLEARAEV
jgi:hypothetical protein